MSSLGKVIQSLLNPKQPIEQPKWPEDVDAFDVVSEKNAASCLRRLAAIAIPRLPADAISKIVNNIKYLHGSNGNQILPFLSREPILRSTGALIDRGIIPLAGEITGGGLLTNGVNWRGISLYRHTAGIFEKCWSNYTNHHHLLIVHPERIGLFDIDEHDIQVCLNELNSANLTFEEKNVHASMYALEKSIEKHHKSVYQNKLNLALSIIRLRQIDEEKFQTLQPKLDKFFQRYHPYMTCDNLSNFYAKFKLLSNFVVDKSNRSINDVKKILKDTFSIDINLFKKEQQALMFSNDLNALTIDYMLEMEYKRYNQYIDFSVLNDEYNSNVLFAWLLLSKIHSRYESISEYSAFKDFMSSKYDEHVKITNKIDVLLKDAIYVTSDKIYKINEKYMPMLCDNKPFPIVFCVSRNIVPLSQNKTECSIDKPLKLGEEIRVMITSVDRREDLCRWLQENKLNKQVTVFTDKEYQIAHDMIWPKKDVTYNVMQQW